LDGGRLLSGIDRLYINQADVAERSKQFLKMKQTYEQAKSIDIWLGPGDEQIDITLSSVNEFVATSYSWQQHSNIFDDIFRPFLRSLPLTS
jgi:hypothetical protein